jgi:hypothetical protein
MVPRPEAPSFDALNARFLEQCVERRQAILRGHEHSIGDRLVADLTAFMPLPTVPFDPCHMVTGRASSMALVRYRTNDYSVPTAYAHQEVVIKGYVDRVSIICGGEQIAVHPRSYEREDFIANPLHYLALLEQKPRALDQAAPLDGWVLAEPMHRIRRLMEARSGKEGRREFIQVLRLCERFEQPLVEWAVARALEMGAISFDAVKMIALARLAARATPRSATTRTPAMLGALTRAVIWACSRSPAPRRQEWRHERSHDAAAGHRGRTNQRAARRAAGKPPQSTQAAILRARI